MSEKKRPSNYYRRALAARYHLGFTAKKPSWRARPKSDSLALVMVAPSKHSDCIYSSKPTFNEHPSFPFTNRKLATGEHLSTPAFHRFLIYKYINSSNSNCKAIFSIRSPKLFKLGIIQGRIRSVFRHQSRVVASFDNLTVIQDDNLVGVVNCRQSVGNYEGRSGL